MIRNKQKPNRVVITGVISTYYKHIVYAQVTQFATVVNPYIKMCIKNIWIKNNCIF